MTATTKLQPTSEHADIMALIEAETTAFLNQDLDGLCGCWVQEPYIQHTSILPYCRVVQLIGITGLRDFFLTYFENDTSLEIEPEAIGRKNWKIVVRENMAWVTFEQLGATNAARHMSGLQMHTRVLEKVLGHWKLVASTCVQSRYEFYDCPKIHIDGFAKIIQVNQTSRDVIAAHPVLEISRGRLSAVTQKDATKLRNAVQETQKNIEIGNVHLPIPIIFGEESDPDSSLCWIAILDMMIVVLLNDDGLIKRTIEKAGQIYGLSQTQMRIAENIAKGKDLNCIANTLEVSTNTVRTHV